MMDETVPLYKAPVEANLSASEFIALYGAELVGMVPIAEKFGTFKLGGFWFF